MCEYVCMKYLFIYPKYILYPLINIGDLWWICMREYFEKPPPLLPWHNIINIIVSRGGSTVKLSTAHSDYSVYPILIWLMPIQVARKKNSNKQIHSRLFGWLLEIYILATSKESLLCLTTPLEQIDFHIIGYWTSIFNWWSMWHISLEETCCRHIECSFR